MKYFTLDSDECHKYKSCKDCPMRKLMNKRYGYESDNMSGDPMHDIIKKLNLELIDFSPCKTVVQHMIKEDKKALLDAWKSL